MRCRHGLVPRGMLAGETNQISRSEGHAGARYRVHHEHGKARAVGQIDVRFGSTRIDLAQRLQRNDVRAFDGDALRLKVLGAAPDQVVAIVCQVLGLVGEQVPARRSA
jgi:hypothetical protein